MLSEESIKEMKDGLQDFVTYYDDHAKDEDDNIIDEECYRIANIIDDAFYYIEQLENKVKQLSKGQHTLMQSKRKWKNRYYKEKQKRREADKTVEQIYSDYQDIGKKAFDYSDKIEQLEKELKEVTTQRNHLATELSDNEDDKQELIEKLEKDKVKYNEFEFMPLQIEKAYNNYYKLGKIDLADEILKIVKGEKE